MPVEPFKQKAVFTSQGAKEKKIPGLGQSAFSKSVIISPKQESEKHALSTTYELKLLESYSKVHGEVSSPR